MGGRGEREGKLDFYFSRFPIIEFIITVVDFIVVKGDGNPVSPPRTAAYVVVEPCGMFFGVNFLLENRVNSWATPYVEPFFASGHDF